MKALKVPVTTPQVVKEAVNKFFGVNLDEPSRKRKFVVPRQIYGYCLCIYTDMNTIEIAKELGYTNHSMAIYCRNTVIDLCDQNPEYKKQVIQVESMIES